MTAHRGYGRYEKHVRVDWLVLRRGFDDESARNAFIATVDGILSDITKRLGVAMLTESHDVIQRRTAEAKQRVKREKCLKWLLAGSGTGGHCPDDVVKEILSFWAL